MLTRSSKGGVEAMAALYAVCVVWSNLVSLA